MSATTVAVTVNAAVHKNASSAPNLDSKPNPRRRKSVVVAESKSTGRMFVEGGDIGFCSNKMVSNERDLGHTIRGGAVLERPQEISHPKRGLVLASPVTTRCKKSPLEHEKPMRQIAFSIFTNSSLLLIVIFGLGWITWKCADQLVNTTGLPLFGVDFDGRISDVEASLKAIEKMMQVQLESLDRKLGSEIGTAGREVTQKIEETSAFFEEEVKKLEIKTKDFGRSLADMVDASLFIQEDSRELLNDFKNSQNTKENDKIWGLDDIHTYAREIIMRQIEKHAADGLGRVDYALASGGATVVHHSEPYGLGEGSWFPLGKGRSMVHENANKMLQPSFGEPGQCFPLRGNTGFVEIKLRTAIILDSVTLEHVAKSVAYDRSSAPKDCHISAWFEGPGDDRSTHIQRTLMLMEFTYNLEKSNAQTFNIEMANVGVINMVRLHFSSNHGNPSHTCIYRLRVHGFDPKSFMEMAM